MPNLPHHHHRGLAACVPLLAALTLPAQAAFTSNASGLTVPHALLDFDDVVLFRNSVVDTQFTGAGVTFTHAIGNPDIAAYPNISGNRIGNFLGGIGSLGTMTLDFGSVLHAAAFSMVTASGGRSTLAAYLDGALVESVSLTTNASSTSNYHVFSDLLFNRLTLSVSSFDGALLIDNLQLAPVPEPGAWALLAAGLAALSLAARRRQGHDR